MEVDDAEAPDATVTVAACCFAAGAGADETALAMLFPKLEGALLAVGPADVVLAGDDDDDDDGDDDDAFL